LGRRNRKCNASANSISCASWNPLIFPSSILIAQTTQCEAQWKIISMGADSLSSRRALWASDFSRRP
jgi:hypothetical protein